MFLPLASSFSRARTYVYIHSSISVLMESTRVRLYRYGLHHYSTCSTRPRHLHCTNESHQRRRKVPLLTTTEGACIRRCQYLRLAAHQKVSGQVGSITSSPPPAPHAMSFRYPQYRSSWIIFRPLRHSRMPSPAGFTSRTTVRLTW